MSPHDETSTTRTTISAERVLLAVAIALILLMNAMAVGMQIGRVLDHDEAEYLHAAWLMSEGKRIYRDFMEDHPPFLFQILQGLMPEAGAPRIDVFHWAVRGRIFTAVCGTWAMIAASLIVWRLTRSGAASVVTLAALLGAHWTWVRGLADIRADAPTLALFVTGMLLLIWEERPSWRMAWLAGWGIALAIAADVWNPKWPLEGLCLGAFYLVQLIRLVRVRWTFAAAAVLPTAVVAAAMYLALVSAASVDDYLFFNFILKQQVFEKQPWIAAIFQTTPPLHYAPPRFAGVVPAALYVVAVAVTWRERRRLGSGRAWRAALILATAAVSALSIRFLFGWPYVWPQYYLMLGFALAMAYGLLADSAIRAAAERRTRAHAPRVALVALAAVAALAVRGAVVYAAEKEPAPWTLAAVLIGIVVAAAPLLLAAVDAGRRRTLDAVSLWRSAAVAAALALAVPQLADRIDYAMVNAAGTSWPARQELLEKLRPGETVWISAARHPIAAHDASYFWYSFPELMPTTLAYVARNPEARRYIPPMTVDDLPVCRLAMGEAQTLRFVEISAYADYVPGACPCAQAVLLGRPGLVPTKTLSVYEIVRGGSVAAPVPVPEWDPMIRTRVAACGNR